MSRPERAKYQDAIQNVKSCFCDYELKEGYPDEDSLGLPKASSGNFGVVFQIKSLNNNLNYAVKCFTRDYPEQEKRYDIISKYLKQTNISYTTGFDFLKQGIKVEGNWYPIVKMDWITGDPLNTYIKKNLLKPIVLKNLSNHFLQLMSELEQQKIAHGDLQHGNIIITNDKIKLIDYDGMYVPGLDGLKSYELGHRNYQHPKRTEKDFGLHLDNFSGWIIYISLLALQIDNTLWNRFGGETHDEHLLFEKKDFDNSASSELIKVLETHSDIRVQLIISFLKSILASELKQICRINENQIEKLILNKISIDSSTWLEDYIKPKNMGIFTKDLPKPQSVISDNLMPNWLEDYIDNIEQLPNNDVDYKESSPIVNINISINKDNPTLFKRIMLCSIFIFSTLAIINYTSLYLTAPITIIEFLVCIIYYRYRFQSLPEVLEKNKILLELNNLQKEIKILNNTINNLNKEKKLISIKENQYIKNIEVEQKNYIEKEKNCINKIEYELKNTSSILNSKIAKTKQDEHSAIIHALKNYQIQFLNSQLSSYRISSASISGIGTELKSRLQSHGIWTAADILDVSIYDSASIKTPRGIIKVYGIGPNKALALLSWKKNLEANIRYNIPSSLPSHEELNIKSAYEAQTKILYSQLDNATKDYEQKKKNTISEYQQKQQELVKKITDIKNEFTKENYNIENNRKDYEKQVKEKQNELKKVEIKMSYYKSINFINYFKQLIYFRDNNISQSQLIKPSIITQSSTSQPQNAINTAQQVTIPNQLVINQPQKTIQGTQKTQQIPNMVYINTGISFLGNFYIGKYPVTNKEYCKYKPSHKNPGDDLPVVNVSWNDAVDYCKWLSQKTGKSYRLPTEEEWEYAYGAGSKANYYWGDIMDSSYCWHIGNSGGKVHPVGQKTPNKYGLYDMSGNVWEWCSDYFGISKNFCVFRGGGWDSIDLHCQSGYRGGNVTDYCNINVGFRVVIKP